MVAAIFETPRSLKNRLWAFELFPRARAAPTETETRGAENVVVFPVDVVGEGVAVEEGPRR